jgi:predicted metalloprotease
MRMEDEKESENVLVHRAGGRGRRVVAGAGGLGIGGVIIVGLLMLIAPDWMKPFIQMFAGGDGPSISQQTGASNDAATTQRGCPRDDADCIFVAKVLTSTEDVWTKLFQDGRMAVYTDSRAYPKPTLNIFSGAISSGCGDATSAVGPFYCPTDNMVYIDPGFFDVMKEQLGASGDFAEAYVIAHEVGHHVQNVMGLASQVQRARQQARSEEEGNGLSVRMELMADCLAGVWGHYAQVWKNQVSPGDIDEALNAANAIGDDTLQKRGRGFSTPHSFTHGSSAQRVAWFKRGFSNGDPAQCNAFSDEMMRTPVSRI